RPEGVSRRRINPSHQPAPKLRSPSAPFYLADREALIRILRSTRRKAPQDAERSEGAPKG
ncbi:MAG: hypothetical protein KUF75_19370, partial [Candidatus Thiodiazotropha sp. (ex Ctena orbiculata)]|nr:hypothetical protein [Candidatus Thiodiazotropha taylori]